ncbi:site-specific integrase [Pseudomonas sp. S37]|nr:site-specific integrase [Pseudomonas sp. S37]
MAWAKRRETELSEPGAVERGYRVGRTVKQMIERYLVEAEKARPLGETKRRTLNAIKNSYLGEMVDSDISQQVLADYALWLMSPAGGGIKPQTAGNNLVYLSSVLSLARAA